MQLFGTTLFGFPRNASIAPTANPPIGSYRLFRNTLETDNPVTGTMNLILLSRQDRFAYQIIDATGPVHTIPNRFCDGYTVGLNNQRRMLVFRNGKKLEQNTHYSFVEQGSNFNIQFQTPLVREDVIEIVFLSRLNLADSYYHTEILGNGQRTISWSEVNSQNGNSVLLFSSNRSYTYRKEFLVLNGRIELTRPVNTSTRFEVYLLSEFDHGGERNYLFDNVENTKNFQLRNHASVSEFPYSL